MESQMQQPESQATASPEDSTALRTAPETKFSPTAQSVQKGKLIFTQLFVFLTNIFDYLGNFFSTYKQLIISLALILGAIVALKLVLAMIGALNDIPLLAPTFKLIGIAYSVWFVSRYLLKSSTRKELYDTLQGFIGKHISMEDEPT